MAFKDILVAATSYPEPTPAAAVEDAVSVATALSTHIAALCCEIRVEVPGNVMSSSMVAGMIASESHKSRDNAKALLAAFDAAATRSGVLHETVLEKCLPSDLHDIVVQYARLRDLTILPWSTAQSCAETVIFGSGRPTLVMPESPRQGGFKLQTVVVAWDFSRAATRAVADALPILEDARTVRIVSVTEPKVVDTGRSAEELAKNLARHGINVVLDVIEPDARPIGTALEFHAQSHAADLLVMGGYGHSRWREFVLGGATKSLLKNPPLPVLFSH
jgi:nucleotide-binding universal stress UspA family protein